ncbi:ABC transporter substrate-binding protein [Butyrivibrio sp. INlla16]|uniref:ABC transporter substrate-binding protein n=1 Tax=Butyrivibrio sp. INlla16 TaxID=1520807 RepID=UPI00089148F3|nr:extracellular solute-binding protein [Butyrivibrio sp. INlla16]SDB50944.1 ABC-type glycerol-3-phosphate transport system, substrate-binding protein [Butyrivibrio sp. INlla16]
MKKRLLNGMIGVMILLCACGSKQKVSEVGFENEGNIYDISDVVLPVDTEYVVKSICMGKDSIYIHADVFNDDIMEDTIYKASLDLEKIEELPLKKDDQYIDNFTCDNEGNIYFLGCDDNGNIMLSKSENTGDIIWSVPVELDEEGSIIQSMEVVEREEIILDCEEDFLLYDIETGAERGSVSSFSKESDCSEGMLKKTKDGDICYIENIGKKKKLYQFDSNQNVFVEKDVALDNFDLGNGLFTGMTYDFYVYDQKEICGFNIGDKELTHICDFRASDIYVAYIEYICEADDGKILMMCNGESDLNSLTCLTPSDGKDIHAKQTITIGTDGVPESLSKQVAKFNKANTKYKIKIVDYSNNENIEADYITGTAKLGLDMAKGQGPDIIVLGDTIPLEDYSEKGALEPLDSYFSADKEINMSDYLSNIIDMTKVDGKIYSIIPSYTINTCVAAKNAVGSEKVTLVNYEEKCLENGIDPKVGMGLMTRASADDLFSVSGEYVDYKNGTCNFESDQFMTFLEFVKGLPSYEDFDDIDYEKFEDYYRQKKALLKEEMIGSFDQYQAIIKGYFGSEIVFNGYPTSNGGESFVSSDLQIAMNASCAHKDGAWEFMKSFLLDDYQSNLEQEFPISKNVLEELADRALEKPYEIDEDGEKVEIEKKWYVGSVAVEIGELSKEEVDCLVKVIKEATEYSGYNFEISNIISEEAEAYYEEQKSAEEVAEIIQSRVSLYLSENR